MSKKGENIYKRKDGRWEGRYIKSRTESGKIIYGYVYARSYREAKEKQKAKIASYTSQITNKNEHVFSYIASEWFESIKLHTKTSTQNKYHNMLTNYILPEYGNQPFNTITYEFIEAHCKFLLESEGKKGNGLSTKTVSDVLAIIRNISKFAIRKGIYVANDANAVQIRQDIKPMRVLNKAEQRQLCEYILKRPEACSIGILVCMFTGLRIGEICALRWEDISFSDQSIYIHHTLQRIQMHRGHGAKTEVIVTTPKSSCSIRKIPLPDEILEILVLNKKASSGYVLTNDEYKFIEPRTMQNKFKKILKAAGIENANFHALRHTFATRCVELGFDVKSLSEILGHATVNITMNRYVHPTYEMKKENMKKLSGLLAVK
ncbi:MAG: tyrosine-type recombinase/integrase [Lachnospiraceae bacterium]|jgi:site-specific recombinase|uniref:Site-specific integrase n=4 Tax=Mediterraneibacter gnavus TaxID=33038 RepID=A0A415S5P9_MEDGN|nr:site-specific integrase [Mediterraneibacter gnavus]MDU2006890.1 tyrosine-type recombinase/integrase [Lachnospiraceae bacterium]MDU2033477.1 tyrosine-type recombinase/integrase [Lachnospiraceae bacterium]RHM71051.1 site-specific integrase [Mediterraneibacter gnavus]